MHDSVDGDGVGQDTKVGAPTATTGWWHENEGGVTSMSDHYFQSSVQFGTCGHIGSPAFFVDYLPNYHHDDSRWFSNDCTWDV